MNDPFDSVLRNRKFQMHRYCLMVADAARKNDSTRGRMFENEFISLMESSDSCLRLAVEQNPGSGVTSLDSPIC